MTTVSQLIISSLVTGSVLALVAFGYNLVYSTTRIINFAQGATVVVAGYLTWYMNAKQGWPIFWAVLMGILLSALVGVLVWAIAILPLGQFDPATNIGWILTTFSCFIIAQTLVGRFITLEAQTLPPLSENFLGLTKTTQIFGAPFDPARAFLVVGTILIMIALELLYSKTITGRAFKAVAEDRMAASLMGINVNVVVAGSFALAGATAAMGAVLLAPIQGINFISALLLGIQGFIAAVLGGLGSTKGAIVGGYLMGFLKALLLTIAPQAASYEQLVIFGLFIAVLLFRPTGFFGEPAVEKV